MHNFILLCLFSVLFVSLGISQVYVSETIDNNIIVGPENVDEDQEKLAPYYIAQLNDLKTKLNSQIEEELIVELEKKEKLKKEERKEYRIALIKKEENDREISKVDSMLNFWNEIVLFQKSLLEASELIEEGACVEFKTKTGTIASSELKIEIRTYKHPINFNEIIPVEYTAGESKWEKRRKDRNCSSPDPEDCLVWCLVEIEEGYTFLDMSNQAHTYETCPTEFSYDESNKNCYLEKVYNEDSEILEIVTLINKANNEIIKATEWKLVDCVK